MLLNKLWFVINYVRECTVNIFFFQTIHAHLSYQFFLLLYCFWNQRKYKRISTEFLSEIDFFSNVCHSTSTVSSSDERYVWPWTGIVANIFGKPKHEPVECDSMYWLRKFEQYKPEEAYVLHCAEDPTGYVVLEFGTEWTGFTQMMKLDTDFLVDHHGKKDYYESR